jgi:hypothetical protein
MICFLKKLDDKLPQLTMNKKIENENLNSRKKYAKTDFCPCEHLV